jgi:hypothetical protein
MANIILIQWNINLQSTPAKYKQVMIPAMNKK